MSGMITAVALNPAIDRTVLVPAFATGATNRVTAARLDPGGKGINVARVARALGAEVRVVGFLGTNNGNLIERSLAAQQIETEFVGVCGDTRVNLKIVNPETGELTELNEAAFSVEEHHLRALLDLIEARLSDTSVLVLAGSLPTGVPPEIYRDLVEQANARGVLTILDADGEPMQLALAAKPSLIKPNHSEAERLLGRALATHADLMDGAAALLAKGPSRVVVSSGERGAGLISADSAWWAVPPGIRAGSTVGAGDSMVAGLAVALARGLGPVEALRLATAAGTATASLEGTQVCSAEGVAALLPQVTVGPVTMEMEANTQ